MSPSIANILASNLITREHTQEALQLAFVHALAGRAGLNLGAKATFDYGIDGTFFPVKKVGAEIVPSGFPLNFQMKATTDWWYGDDYTIGYDLSARMHRILTTREPGEAMMVLLLLCLPREDALWMEGCEDFILLRHCCYWFRPDGPPTENTSTARVWVPRVNLVTPESLQAVMRLARAEAQAGQ